MEKKIIIAVDGFSACGKSTLAKQIAKVLNILFVDSGAMYRAVSYYFLQHGIDLNNKKDVEEALNNISLEMTNGEPIKVLLNKQDVSNEIRSMEVAKIVSDVAAISAVRKKLVSLQQEMGKHQSLIMDGRDIGTVVFPNADVKLFVTAQEDIRTERRLKELLSKGQMEEFEDIKQNLKYRDLIDSTREDSPLRQAEDAIIFDNSHMTKEEQVNKALEIIKTKMDIDI